MLYYATYDSPVGLLYMVDDGGKLISVSLGLPPQGAMAKMTDVLQETIKQLTEYFAGERCSFSLPLELRGTPFQVSVWKALLDIPYGQTQSYGQLAASIGSPRSARAVGGANHRNPLLIVVPCHRVIGSNGSLTGFAGGIDVKIALLRLEHAIL